MTTTNPTLVGGASKVFASSGSTTLTLYGVQSEDFGKTAGFIEYPVPTQDSNNRILMDLMGAGRQITVSGVVTTGDVADLYKYWDDLVGLGNNSLITASQGNTTYQKPGYDYTPEAGNRGRSVNTTIRVYVQDAKVFGEKGNPNSFRYSLTLVECSGTTSV